jgi:glycerol-3-phosphate dehydrogenase (NAD(P)+)
MESSNATVGVIGAGAWGTALAILANRAGSKVTLWTRNPNVVDSIMARRTNDIYLPDIFIDPGIVATNRIQDAARCDIVILAVPSQKVRTTCIALSDYLQEHVPVVIASKGLERGSLLLMSEVVEAVLSRNPVAILTGPNFADEAARGLPTAATLACENGEIGNLLLFALGGKFFRPYLTDDYIGAQIGGAVKNVIAIACGIAQGRGFGENARAALITRGLAEMTRLCTAKGGRQQTPMGLSGMGDLVLTCTSAKSRNTRFGLEIGREGDRQKVLSQYKSTTAEGIASSESVTDLAKRLGISMPICAAVRAILFEDSDINKVIQGLLDRAFVPEVQYTSV